MPAGAADRLLGRREGSAAGRVLALALLRLLCHVSRGVPAACEPVPEEEAWCAWLLVFNHCGTRENSSPSPADAIASAADVVGMCCGCWACQQGHEVLELHGGQQQACFGDQLHHAALG